MNRLSSRALVVFILVNAHIQTARAVERTIFEVAPARSTISYTITHKLHTVTGVSRQAQGKVALLPDGTVQIMIVAPVNSFDSKNSGRDEHMQETMQAASYPIVGFKGLAKITPPTTFPATVNANVQGEMEFHGRKKMETIPVEITFNAADDIHAKAKFNVSLDKYEVERPSLMLMKIDDACQVALDLSLQRS